MLFKNSYEEIDKIISKTNLEDYDLIIMLGLRNNLKKSIRIETATLLDNDFIETNIDCKRLNEYFIKNEISCLLNSKPTNYLCNYAYHQVLRRNKNTIFIHLPELKNIIDIDKLTNLISHIKITTII